MGVFIATRGAFIGALCVPFSVQSSAVESTDSPTAVSQLLYEAGGDGPRPVAEASVLCHPSVEVYRGFSSEVIDRFDTGRPVSELEDLVFDLYWDEMLTAEPGRRVASARFVRKHSPHTSPSSFRRSQRKRAGRRSSEDSDSNSSSSVPSSVSHSSSESTSPSTGP